MNVGNGVLTTEDTEDTEVVSEFVYIVLWFKINSLYVVVNYF